MMEIEIKIVEVVPFQTCPKCNGQGSVSKPPEIAGDITTWSDCVGIHTCNVCNGEKVIPMHVIEANEK